MISVVAPKEYESEQQEWIQGIKSCSSDAGFWVNFFFEEEKDRKLRIQKEEAMEAGILTEEDLKKDGTDPYVQGYRAAEALLEKTRKVEKKQAKKRLKVGIALYNQKDVFLHTLCEKIEELLEKTGQERDTEVLFLVEYADGSAQEQNSQIRFLMEQECDILLLNLVDTWSASQVIDQARECQIPVIFFNREPSDEDIRLWEKACYVGTDGEEIGKLQGEILIEAFCENRAKMDKNQDGVLQYLSVEGEEGHSDSVRRTAAMLKKTEETFLSKQIGAISADWSRENAKQQVLQLSKEQIEACEAVICNNDDMALGVLDALKERNIQKLPAIVGVNGEQEVLEKIRQGEFLGTVSQKVEEQARTITRLVWDFREGKDPKGEPKCYLEGEKYQKTP